MSDLVERLKAKLASMTDDEIQESWEIACYGCRKNIVDIQYTRVLEYICNLPINKLDVQILKFLAWEEKYEEFQYTYRHKQTSSKLFNAFINVIDREFGTEIELNNEDDFVSSRFEFRGYTFSLFVGQGAFWRIEKDGKTIFQGS